MRVVLDAMGGDNAPEQIVLGAILAVNEFGCQITLVGDEQAITKILQENNEENNKLLKVVNANSVIDMCDNPNVVVKEKRDSSMGVAFDILAKGEADSMVSAGNTGAILTGGTLIIKRIKGIRRASLAPMIPTQSGKTLLIDSGANTECTQEILQQFGIMGSIYFKNVMKTQNPKVGLINNGAEETKGTQVIQDAYKLLKKSNDEKIINFIGNIEGRDVAIGTADVIVADGFTGNILLKTYEGVGIYISNELKNIFYKNILTKVGALLVKDGLDDLKRMMDYKEVGGAPMLGLEKPVIKAHGSSDAYAIRSAINQAINYNKSGVIEDIKNQLAKK